MKDNFCYFNGEILRFSEIKISPFDLGFVRGYGIFDAMRTANGVPFCLNEHWEKFNSSAQLLNLEIPLTKEQFKEIIRELQEKNNFKEMGIKTILTGGESENGFIRSNRVTFLIIVDNLVNFNLAPEFYKEGVKIISYEHRRSLAEIKNLNYLFPLNIQKQKNDAGALEIVYKKDGKILECSTSNIFIVKNGCIITTQENIFQGTTRNLVISLARKKSFPLEEREINQEEFMSADEIFLTATYKKIVPVVKVDKTTVNNGKIGIITQTLMQKLDDFIANYKEE